ncbi:hypothetical protein D8I24_6492 [Cupriavidus necator H850]|uniref:ASCH domain-containing protein n=1 Tax=Cupriavidus necator TaxID=106590 RepID=UPI00129DA8DC|nr:ASCH domain-containing protein [Cupriavidus necator]KAI3597676.1 hypothetical protein D8I24_6492 [Cupriavidus necator H850]
MKALSIRQPWAWLIVNGHKDIENRSWATKHRGPVLIHASKGMTRREYQDVQYFLFDLYETGPCNATLIKLPKIEALERGGIVGIAHVTDCVRESGSPWHMPDCWGFKLSDARPVPFIAMPGKLGFFEAWE